MRTIALIPAYNPGIALVEYVKSLLASDFYCVIVNDGSRAECTEIFSQIKNLADVCVLNHAINLGKGAALKTGLNHIACECPDAAGVVTIDADGQHLLKDALEVRKTLLESPKKLVVGVRGFEAATPFRSRFGNKFTKFLFRLLTGISLSDTQSGLRGIPLNLIPRLLKITANGYEFELDMLLAAHREGYRISETAITTVYLDGNKSSHFRPVRDSLRIYFVLFRFTIIALLSAGLDYLVFITFYYFALKNVMACLIGGRLVSTTFNYLNVKRYAFHFRGAHEKSLPQYLLLAVCSTAIAYSLIIGFITLFGWHVVFAKLVSEFVMFVVNFTIQRDYIFKTRDL